MLDVEAVYRENAEELRLALRRRFDSSVPDAVIEDACGSTWLIAWAKRHEVRDGNAMGWLVTVAFHEALALLSKRRSETPVDGAERADARTSPDLIREAHEALELLAALTPNQRVALSLQLAGYSYKELAELTGKTYTWVNRHVTEGRAALRQRGGLPEPRPRRCHRSIESRTTWSACWRSPAASASRPAASAAGGAPLAVALSIAASSSSVAGPLRRNQGELR